MDAAWHGHKGHVKPDNEDQAVVLVPEELGCAAWLLVVADGLGGGGGGRASEITADYLRSDAPALLADAAGHGFDALAEALSTLMQGANTAIWSEVRSGEGPGRMATTCTAAVVSGADAAIAHVGDSRAYLVRGHEAQLLTADHALMEEMEIPEERVRRRSDPAPYHSVLTRALGRAPVVEIDQVRVALADGDALVLCSDGLSAMLSDRRIGKLVAASHSPETACQRLVNLALRRGGYDNVTVAALTMGERGGDDEVGADEAEITPPRRPEPPRGLAARLIRRITGRR
ncbi:MAG: protein phosphatase 2C domain-containing protein [Armatimonadetes bacterium]|nr:protein phosphatase 2C domain-containing protein [Armatimonadota bacterium]